MLGVARDGAPPDFTFTRATTATRVNSSGLIESVASGVPRIDWLGQSCPALLVEASGQNLAFHSESWVSGNNWGLLGLTNATGAIAAPNGTITANALSPTAVSGSHFMTGNNPTTVIYTSGTIYTQSAFFKAGTGAAGQLVQLTFASARFTQEGYANFDLSAGTVSVVSGSSADANRAAKIENYGNGWYRCIFTATCNINGTGVSLIPVLITASGSGRTPTFTGVTGDVLYGWGAQLETGAIPTSYIPTTTGSATRNADVCTVSGVSGYIGQTQGTLYLDLSYEQGSATGNRWLELFGSSNNIGLAVANTNLIRSIVNGLSDSLTGTDARNRFKIAWGYDSSGVICFINGTQFTLTNGGAQVITSLDSFRIDMSTATGQRIFNNRLRAAAIYTTRLSNDQLANITRLT
jgi:hypothetical protein